MEELFSELSTWIEGVRNAAIKNLALAVVIIAAAVAAHSLGRRAIGRAFDRAEARTEARARANAHSVRRKLGMARSAALGVFRYAILAAAAFWILSLFGVNLASALAVAGVGGLAIGIGAQNLVRDVINGMLIWFEDQYAVGDEVTIGMISGTVEDFSLRATRVRLSDGHLCTIPNSAVSVVSNGSKGFRRAIVDIGIPEGVDLNRALAAFGESFADFGKGGSLSGLLENAVVEGVSSFYAGADASKGAFIRVSASCEPDACETVGMEIRLRASVTVESLTRPNTLTKE